MTYQAPKWLPRSLTLAALLLPLPLTGCTLLHPSPPIPNAQLDLDRSVVTLRPGERAVVWLAFSKMLYGQEPEGRYRLTVHALSPNYRVTAWTDSLGTQSQVRLEVEAARNASAERDRVYVYVSDGFGNVLSDSFEVRIQPVTAQPAPVRRVPLHAEPVQPAPVTPVPLLP